MIKDNQTIKYLDGYKYAQRGELKGKGAKWCKDKKQWYANISNSNFS